MHANKSMAVVKGEKPSDLPVHEVHDLVSSESEEEEDNHEKAHSSPHPETEQHKSGIAYGTGSKPVYRETEALDEGTSARFDQLSPTFMAQLKGLLDEQRRGLENYVDGALKDVRNDLATEIKSIRFELNLLNGETVKFFTRATPVIDYTMEKLDVSSQNITIIV
ncbi:hypothetical protein KSP39_PZI015838 [Platanthera zijinensis]|uniref:Uncharacterized protein n=1 Tax=Platanthera zijinensis TaxID=2320716 RepID=A0AAP0B8I9_9ASPA